MKKRVKAKASKSSSKANNELPDLVAVMTKFLERIEALEKKTDQVISGLSALPAQMRHAPQPAHHPEPSHYHAPTPPHSGHGSQQNHGPRERILYQAICADCRKGCEVPFKPTGDRPVYCKECFVIRKAGHVPKDPTAGIKIPNFPKPVTPVPQGPEKKASSKHGVSLKKKKQKAAKKSKK